MSHLSVLILAAGKGTRMKSALPKVLHPVGGVPMIERTLRSVAPLKPRSLCVVVGHGADQVVGHVRSRFQNVVAVRQRVLNGSGGAVRPALAWLKRQKGEVLVVCGDAPLLTAGTFRNLVSSHRLEKNQVTVLTALMADPARYGRIVRGDNGAVSRIVEYLDASPEERKINEINTGTYVFQAAALVRAIPQLKNNNAKREYYLTDALEILGRNGRIGGVASADAGETLGVNSRADLAAAERVLSRRNAHRLMEGGVTILDPDSCFIGDEVTVGPDTVIWPNTFVLGSCRIGRGCVLGPWSFVRDTIMEEGAVLEASFSEKAVIRKGARVGPYSRLRPQTDVGPNAHVGNFTELKNARLGKGAKANHLSYLGDATVGKNANIGAGTITCNYDGFKKSPTEIQDHAFIGSNVNLIAPVRIGAHAVVGAGSSISEEVPPWALALERSEPLVKKDWARHRKKGKKR